jgi:hypothetical protein
MIGIGTKIRIRTYDYLSAFTLAGAIMQRLRIIMEKGALVSQSASIGQKKAPRLPFRRRVPP